MAFVIAAILIAWGLLIWNKVSHVLAYLGVLCPATVVSSLACVFAAGTFEVGGTHWERGKAEECSNYTITGMLGDGTRSIQYNVLDGHSYISKSVRYTSTKPISGNKVLWVEYVKHPNNNSKYYWLGMGWLQQDYYYGSDVQSKAYELEVPEAKLADFLK